MADLQANGLLDKTLVVLGTEFGRTPRINGANGRDHHNKAFTRLLAGAGIKGGEAYGKTDGRGAEVEDNAVSIPDFNATIAQAIGLPVKRVEHSRINHMESYTSPSQPCCDMGHTRFNG